MDVGKLAIACAQTIRRPVHSNLRDHFEINCLYQPTIPETQPQLHAALLRSDKMNIGRLPLCNSCNSPSFGVVLHVSHVLQK
jgi:hypothetical protein